MAAIVGETHFTRLLRVRVEIEENLAGWLREWRDAYADAGLPGDPFACLDSVDASALDRLRQREKLIPLGGAETTEVRS